MTDLPSLALSVRQPWAWAIVAGHKKIENRSGGAIRSGNMRTGRICIHAAAGLKRDEFHWGYWRLARHGVQCPRPEDLPRGAIIGTVEVVDIIDQSDSEWFGGPMGLVLQHAQMVDPIPAKGALGYFPWKPGGACAATLPWMQSFDPMTSTSDQPTLFDDLPVAFASDPTRPRRKNKD
jgi:hypothetical protein